MASVEEKVQAVLAANEALTAAVPAASIRSPGSYQNVARPWIAHFPAGSVIPTYTHDGLRKLRIWDRYQVTLYADTYSSGRPITELILAAMTGVHTTFQAFWLPGGFRPLKDPDRDVYHFVLEFRIVEAAD